MRSIHGCLAPASFAGLLCLGVGAAGCQSPSAAANDAIKTESVYNRQTGRLEQLKADTDGNGTLDATAHLDGTALKDIEIDRDGDGLPDRWEYYGPGTSGAGAAANKFDRWAVILRAEEASRPDAPRTRREHYDRGILQRVEEDTDLDGRMDKWEFYTRGDLSRVELDLSGKGVADRRLIYGPTGDVIRIERDRRGDGHFEPMEEPRP
ncbi:MAG: hypothetical protein IT184_02870 [Acidobacteria bacterium]|nr:hypothetical protein [Acidobacteriota bacterium]